MSDAVDWVEKTDVPVYDAHIVVDRETGLEHRIDGPKLQAIADRMNKRFEETGEESPIVIGHTRDGRPEWEQPPIVGYAHDFYVADNPKAGRPFLYARRYKLYKESTVGGEKLSAEEILKRYPRRSPEVWLNKNEIDPLALLGATTPMRDLGLVRNARQPLKYSAKAGMDYSAIVMAVEALLQQLKGGLVPEGSAEPEFDPANDLDSGNEQTANEAGAAPGDQEVDQGAEFSQPEDAEEGDGGENPFKKKYQMDQDHDSDDMNEAGGEEDAAKQYQAACASSTNSYLPGSNMNEPKKKTESGELERVKMQRDQAAIQAHNFEKRLTALEAENKALREARHEDRLKYQRQVRAADLKQLVSEGYALDVAEEVEEVATMSEENYKKYVDRVRKRYSRVPVGEDFIHTARISEGGPRQADSSIRDKAIEIAGRKGLDFAAALRMAQHGEQ